MVSLVIGVSRWSAYRLARRARIGRLPAMGLTFFGVSKILGSDSLNGSRTEQVPEKRVD